MNIEEMSHANNKQQKSPSSKPKVHIPILGGQETSLPNVIESFLSWLLCLSCLLVSGFYYCIYRYQIYKQQERQQTNQSRKEGNEKICLLPLTTCSKHEIQRISCVERLEQLERYLNHKFGYIKSKSSEHDLIYCIRSDIMCRRLATLAMCFENSVLQYDPKNDFALELVSIWPLLLPFPNSKPHASIKISVVIIAYRENGKTILKNLQQMYLTSHNPRSIEIILINAGQNIDFDDDIALSIQRNPWGNVNYQIAIPSGRGQCFNYGASFAIGSIITFCHADMIVPTHWDASILNSFQNNNIPSSTTLVNCCAFSFGIANSNKTIPGLKAVEYTANVRCKLFHLPYGDQILSIPNSIFHYIGGFPNQALMEDYVLIDLLRKRCFYLQEHQQQQKESIRILSDVASCSSRRWEKLGVLYVTFMNSKIVHWYVSGEKTIEQLYAIYYGSSSNVVTMLSPWEVDLDKCFLLVHPGRDQKNIIRKSKI